MTNRGRGSPALQEFFTEAFAATLIHDFSSTRSLPTAQELRLTDDA